MVRPFIENLHANLQRRLTLLNLRSTKTHHLDHQHLPHTGKIIPRLLTPPHRYNLPNRGELHGPGHSDRVMRGQAKHINSTNCISPGMPRMGTQDRQDPRPVTRIRQDGRRGKGGRCCGALGRVSPDVRIRPLPAPGAWQGGAMTAVAQ